MKNIEKQEKTKPIKKAEGPYEPGQRLFSEKNIISVIVAGLAAVVLILLGNEIYKVLPSQGRNAGFDQPQYSGQFYPAEVIEILEEGRNEEFGQTYQVVKVKILTGPEKGNEVEIRNEMQPGIEESRMVKEGEKIVVNKNEMYSENLYVITDKFRLSAVVVVTVFFLALVFLTSGTKGLKSLLGLVFSVLVLLRFVIPGVLAGHNPLLISVLAALIIAGVSIYLAHGFSKRTSLALVSTLITVSLAAAFAVFFVDITKLFGLGSEESFFLKFGDGQVVNLRGLLLGGIIFGTLGVLDDVTTSQTAAVAELKRANEKLGFGELYKRGLVVGKEHIASLINTLALAYIGSSFPLFLLFYLNTFEPFWITLNSEFMVEEIVRTFVGSSALILAVPISTVIAARYLNKNDREESDSHSHFH